jgi:hypothetical protein
VPLAEYPTWIRPAVQHQPMSYAVDAMRGLSLGGPVLAPATGILLWSVGIVVVCVVPMVIGYRKASTRWQTAVGGAGEAGNQPQPTLRATRTSHATPCDQRILRRVAFDVADRQRQQLTAA